MTIKHTPGPWLCHPDPNTDAKYVVFNADGDYLTLEYEVQEANARLIAAAPELLEALESILSHLGGWGGDTTPLEKARMAIAKARGD